MKPVDEEQTVQKQNKNEKIIKVKTTASLRTCRQQV